MLGRSIFFSFGGEPACGLPLLGFSHFSVCFMFFCRLLFCLCPVARLVAVLFFPLLLQTFVPFTCPASACLLLFRERMSRPVVLTLLAFWRVGAFLSVTLDHLCSALCCVFPFLLQGRLRLPPRPPPSIPSIYLSLSDLPIYLVCLSLSTSMSSSSPLVELFLVSSK